MATTKGSLKPKYIKSAKKDPKDAMYIMLQQKARKCHFYSACPEVEKIYQSYGSYPKMT